MVAVAATVAVGLLLWAVGTRSGSPGSPAAATGPSAPAAPAASPSPSSLFPGSRLPLQFKPGRWLCPVGTVAAYVSGQHYYEAGHPLHPLPETRPVACFTSPSAAEQAGFTEGAAQQGSYREGSVWMVPAEVDRWEPACRRAATRLGFAVPCPTSLPAWDSNFEPSCDTSSSQLTLSPICVWQGRAFVFAFNFNLAQGVAGSTRYVIVAYRLAIPPDPEVAFALGCAGGDPMGTTGLSIQEGLDVRAHLLACPEGPPPVFGTNLLRWVHGGVTYEVGVAASEDAFAVAQDIARDLALIPPPE